MTSENSNAPNEEAQKTVQELQIIEHNLHNLLMQKQAFQLELNETSNALEEVKKTKDEVYKVTGSIMLKADKPAVLKELEEKKKIFELRVNTIEKQEKIFESKAKDLQEQARKFLEKDEKK